VGVTSNLVKRVYEHKQDFVEGFTKKYKIHNLVYFEETNTAEEAIRKEKQIKAWRRAWKVELIEKNNPKWEDLYKNII
jgi:putative endonuclease